MSRRHVPSFTVEKDTGILGCSHFALNISEAQWLQALHRVLVHIILFTDTPYTDSPNAKVLLQSIVSRIRTRKLTSFISQLFATFREEHPNAVPEDVLTSLQKVWSNFSIPEPWWIPYVVPDSNQNNPNTATIGVRSCNQEILMGKNDARAKGMDLLVITLPDLPQEQLLQQGISIENMIQPNKKGGRWKLVLGPGSMIRRSCKRCAWILAYNSDQMAFTCPTWLMDSVGAGVEVFMYAGEDFPPDLCPHPNHKQRHMTIEVSLNLSENRQVLVHHYDKKIPSRSRSIDGEASSHPGGKKMKRQRSTGEKYSQSGNEEDIQAQVRKRKLLDHVRKDRKPRCTGSPGTTVIQIDANIQSRAKKIKIGRSTNTVTGTGTGDELAGTRPRSVAHPMKSQSQAQTQSQMPTPSPSPSSLYSAALLETRPLPLHVEIAGETPAPSSTSVASPETPEIIKIKSEPQEEVEDRSFAPRSTRELSNSLQRLNIRHYSQANDQIPTPASSTSSSIFALPSPISSPEILASARSGSSSRSSNDKADQGSQSFETGTVARRGASPLFIPRKPSSSNPFMPAVLQTRPPIKSSGPSSSPSSTSPEETEPRAPSVPANQDPAVNAPARTRARDHEIILKIPYENLLSCPLVQDIIKNRIIPLQAERDSYKALCERKTEIIVRQELEIEELRRNMVKLEREPGERS